MIWLKLRPTFAVSHYLEAKGGYWTTIPFPLTNSVEYGLRFALSKSACVKNSGMRPSGRALAMASTEKRVRTSNRMVIIKHTQKIIKRNLVIVEYKAKRVRRNRLYYIGIYFLSNSEKCGLPN
jgi:hypothetical protein